MEEKLDNLIKSVATLTEYQKMSQQKLDEKLKKLEADITASQQDATEKAIKLTKRDRPYEFRKKSHQEQYILNVKVADRIETVTK